MSNHSDKLQFESKLPERNRSGSPYVEVDLGDESTTQKLGAYYIDLQKRNADWFRRKAPWKPPEAFPGPTEVELKLLETFVLQDGKVNLWDFSIDISPSGQLTTSFNEGCENFVRRLELEVHTEE